MESKRITFYPAPKIRYTFNRTSMESKQLIISDCNAQYGAFNRTSMESKLDIKGGADLQFNLLIEPVWNRNTGSTQTDTGRIDF